ncbi:MAG: hypothetical protein QM726_04275 [Chitinophagaceae bacterium]
MKKGLVVNGLDAAKDSHVDVLLHIKNAAPIEVLIANIESGQDTDIVIHSYFQHSADYLRLSERIAQQKRLLDELHPLKSDHSEKSVEQARLEDLIAAKNSFVANALRLAAAFNSIPHLTERLVQAKTYFQQGNILAADKILQEEDLCNDQAALLAQMEYLSKREVLLNEGSKEGPL